MSRILKIALGSQTLLLIYLQVIERVDLFPWNDVRRGNGQETLDIVLGVFMVIMLLASYRQLWIGMLVACFGLAVWLCLQVVTFWTPYLFGASPRWQRIHAANFTQQGRSRSSRRPA